MDYKKILEGVVDIINTAEKSDIGFTNICTYIGENCPELKESEDERIRKELIDYINRLTVTPNNIDRYNTWIAWLEKQGESYTKSDVDDAYLKGISDAKNELEKQGQKPAWSEKDEKEYKYVLKFVDNILNNCGNKKDYEHCKRCYDWLKSLRPQPKQEWSEEDEKIFVNLISYGSLKYTGEQVIDWLKSLRQRIGG